jgi:hypothetical protein
MKVEQVRSDAKKECGALWILRVVRRHEREVRPAVESFDLRQQQFKFERGAGRNSTLCAVDREDARPAVQFVTFDTFKTVATS